MIRCCAWAFPKTPSLYGTKLCSRCVTISASGKDPPGVVYFYAPGRGGIHAEGFLDGFEGTLQVDGYTGYNRLVGRGRSNGPVRLARCWAHARRKLHDIFQKDGSPVAEEGLRQIAEFYRIEADIRGRSPEERCAVRQEKTKPLVEAFGKWLTGQRARISQKSRLGEKLTYIANQWDDLQIFLDDGHVEIDSNAVENLICPIALNRKNALFAGHDEGGRAWGPHRIAHRNRQDQRYRAFRLSRSHTQGHRKRPPPKSHRRPVPMELPKRKLKTRGAETALT